MDNANISNHRIEFIDLAKGICIIWVILWHIEIMPYNIPGLNSVRMPLYFVLSGLFFKTYGSFSFFIKKKINKILIPFLFFYLSGYVVFHFFSYFYPGLIKSSANSILDLFKQREYFNGPIWFLLSLFWSNFIFFIIKSNTHSEVWIFIFVVLSSIIGIVLSKLQIFLPMMVDNSLTALPFFWIGYILKRTSLLFPNKFDKYNLLISLFFYLTALVIDILFNNPRFELLGNNIIGNVPMAYCVSIFSVLFILFLCKAIKYIPFISYFGKYSIIPLCFHHLIYRPIKLFLNSFFGTNCLFIENLILAFLTILLCWLLIPFSRRYLPYVTAQKELIK